MSHIQFIVKGVTLNEKEDKICMLEPAEVMDEGAIEWTGQFTVIIPIDHSLYDDMVEDYVGKFVGPRPPKAH